ncbi:uncharacterized protein LOC115633008 [Scaptodrosophila lebanonensis]|uniref:Uncharacterized protein LOC115633008 n=1 Tax=Drosophila lebanonensis TaxID=7225 RepID=A0A6J2UCV3_DROLE|nr:uncharacterized protein LOC115633008 [Scaptodrosophila lebanonensis]
MGGRKSLQLLRHHLGKVYYRVYVYLSLFAIALVWLLHRTRKRIYTLPLSWRSICVLYGCIACVAFMLTFVTYYGWTAWVVMRRQHRVERLATRRSHILFKFYRLQRLMATSNQAMGKDR